MAKAIHSMIRVLDEARSVAFYETAFGLTVADRLDFDSFTLVYLQQSRKRRSSLSSRSTRVGPSPMRWATATATSPCRCDDVDAEHARLTAAGLAPRKLVDFAPAGTVIARFFFVADPDGYQIEVLQRGGRYL